MTDTPEVLAKAFDLDRRLQNFEGVLHEVINRVAGVSEELRAEWHRILSGPSEPVPAPEPTPAVVDPNNPPSASTEPSATPEPTIVEPDTSTTGTESTPSEATPAEATPSEPTSATPTSE